MQEAMDQARVMNAKDSDEPRCNWGKIAYGVLDLVHS